MSFASLVWRIDKLLSRGASYNPFLRGRATAVVPRKTEQSKVATIVGRYVSHVRSKRHLKRLEITQTLHAEQKREIIGNVSKCISEFTCNYILSNSLLLMFYSFNGKAYLGLMSGTPIWKFENRPVAEGELSLANLFDLLMRINSVIGGKDYLYPSLTDLPSMLEAWKAVLIEYQEILILRKISGRNDLREEELKVAEEAIVWMVKSAKVLLNEIMDATLRGTGCSLVNNAERVSTGLKADHEAIEHVKSKQEADARSFDRISDTIREARLLAGPGIETVIADISTQRDLVFV